MMKYLLFFLLFLIIITEEVKKKEYPTEHYIKLGDQSLKENKYSEASVYYTNALGKSNQFIKEKESGNTKILLKRAQTYFFDKNYRFAEKDLLEIIEKDEKNIEALNLLGKVFTLRTNFEEAIKIYELILKYYPNQSDAKKNYEDSKRGDFLVKQIEEFEKAGKLKETLNLYDELIIKFSRDNSDLRLRKAENAIKVKDYSKVRQEIK
jgi:tetratricopeptide (TPR) repeat protein